MRKLVVIACCLAGAILFDLGWILMFERPLFAIKDNSDSNDQKYFGLFYDVIDCFESAVHVLPKGSKFACPVSELTIPAPMVQKNGAKYIQTGRVSSFAKCGVMDGEITSSVSESETPKQDNQSNFGIGYGYQIGIEGTIEILIDGQWLLFASEERFDELVLDLSDYQKRSNLSESTEADTEILFFFHDHLYAKSYALIDYDGPDGEPLGMIRYVIDSEYVPKLHEETNQEALAGALIYDEGESGIILYYENEYYYFVKIQ